VGRALSGKDELTLRFVQNLMKKYYYKRDSARGLYATFAWLVEEVGELAEALLSGDKEAIAEEIADVLAWLSSVSNLVGIDIEDAFRKKYMSPEPPL